MCRCLPLSYHSLNIKMNLHSLQTRVENHSVFEAETQKINTWLLTNISSAVFTYRNIYHDGREHSTKSEFDDVAYHQILTMLVGEQGWGWLLHFCDCLWEVKKSHIRVITRWANVTTKEPKDFWSVRTPHWYAQRPGNRWNVAHQRNWACHHRGRLQQSVGLWEIMFAKVDYVECTMRWL